MPLLLYNRLVELNPPFDIDVVTNDNAFQQFFITAANTGFTSVDSQPECSLYFEDTLRSFYTPSIYDYILETSTSPAFAPRVTLKPCGLAGTCVIDPQLFYSSYGFDYTSNPDEPVPVYKRNSAGKVKLFTESVPFSWVQDGTTVNAFTSGLNQNVFGAWDWGKPSYCRSQLLALGFTEADLTPVTP